MTVTRLVATADAPALAEMLRDNHEFLAPWDPIRSGDYFTADGSTPSSGGICGNTRGADRTSVPPNP